MRLARYFGASARFWLNLQTTYELAVAEAELAERIASGSDARPKALRRRDRLLTILGNLAVDNRRVDRA